ncbi:hypothetical protein BCR42DRAFT_125751, partial [Absidia repens]
MRYQPSQPYRHQYNINHSTFPADCIRLQLVHLPRPPVALHTRIELLFYLPLFSLTIKISSLFVFKCYN